jgi:hypothetical protein
MFLNTKALFFLSQTGLEQGRGFRMSKDNEDKDFTVADHVSKEKLKMIQETYNIYSEDAVEVKRKSNLNKTPEGKPAESKAPDVKKQVTEDLVIPEAPPKEPKKSKFNYDPEFAGKGSGPKKIITDIESVENLNPELQKNLKKLMNPGTKQEVNKLFEEMEKEKDKFLTKNTGVLGKMSNAEKTTLERKMAETEVPREVTEVNLSAIISGLKNIKID